MVYSQPGGPAPCLPFLSRDSVEWQRLGSKGAAGLCSRVRLALLQGLSQLPGGASQADCLPPTEEGSLLSGLISCQLSVFFVCFCCSLGQTDGVGRLEKQDFQSRALLGQGTSTLSPGPSESIPLPRPSLLLRSVPALSPNMPPALCVQVPQEPTPIFLACLHLQKHYTSVPWSSKTTLNSKLLGLTYEPPRTLPSAVAPSFHGSILSSAHNNSALSISPFKSQL